MTKQSIHPLSGKNVWNLFFRQIFHPGTYLRTKYDDFWKKIDELSIRPINIKVASISAYASEKLSIKDPYPFCKNPLDNIYVSKVNLFDQKILDLLKKVINISDNSNIDHSYQSLLNNGEQTAGNFFEHLDKGLGSLFYQFINNKVLIRVF